MEVGIWRGKFELAQILKKVYTIFKVMERILFAMNERFFQFVSS